MSINSEKVKEIIESEKFRDLVKKRLSVSITLTIVILLVYFGFILIIAFNKEFLSTKIGEHLTLGMPIGIGIIVFAWLLTGVYVKWANDKYDSKVRELRNQIMN